MRRLIFARTKQQFRLKQIGPILCEMEKMLVEGITERERKEWDADNNRGEHFATVFGWSKPYSSVRLFLRFSSLFRYHEAFLAFQWPSLTLLHQRLKKQFEEYASQEEFIELVYVSPLRKFR